MRKRSLGLFIVLLTVAGHVSNAGAYVDFGADGTTNNCQECHNLFGGGTSDPDHEAHRAGVVGGCPTCHGGFPAQLSSPTLPSATGCVGCHGRDQDAGGDAVSDGFGRGLRQHHANAGIGVCAGCHTDTNSMTSPAVGEDVPPPLYAINTFLDPCDGSEERFASAAVSLDNDGDGLTDAADPDCPAPTTTTTSSTTSTTTTTSSTTTTTLAGLIPGGGTTKSDCYVELAMIGIENPSQRVENNKLVLCTDGEACDTGSCGDNECRVRVRLCINQQDPNLPDCTPPSRLDRVKVKAQGTVKLNVAVPALLEGSQCGTFLDGAVPVKVNRRGQVKGAGKAKLVVAAKAPKGTTPRPDKDTITIKCVPRTVACP